MSSFAKSRSLLGEQKVRSRRQKRRLILRGVFNRLLIKRSVNTSALSLVLLRRIRALWQIFCWKILLARFWGLPF